MWHFKKTSAVSIEVKYSENGTELLVSSEAHWSQRLDTTPPRQRVNNLRGRMPLQSQAEQTPESLVLVITIKSETCIYTLVELSKANSGVLKVNIMHIAN